MFIRRLKTTRNVRQLLSSIRNPNPLNHQPSGHVSARGLLPSTLFSVEYELTMMHNLAYPILEPIQLPNITLESLDTSSLPMMLESMTYMALNTADSSSSHPEESKTIAQSIFSANPPIRSSENLLKGFSPVAGPAPPSQLCDVRLNRLNIGFWTNAPISNEFAAGAISTYLETDHALLGFFDADLFLSDLIEQRFSHCSPFLVSSLLYLACVSAV